MSVFGLNKILVIVCFGFFVMVPSDSWAIFLHSNAFVNGGSIPKKYTCEGDDISPPISWSGAPAGTKSLILIMDDPDSRGGTWSHWVVYNIPPETQELKEAVVKGQLKVDGFNQGKTWGTNDFKRVGYSGPCPPRGEHRYVFKVYALDKVLPESDSMNKFKLFRAMGKHILGTGKIVGKYIKEANAAKVKRGIHDKS